MKASFGACLAMVAGIVLAPVTTATALSGWSGGADVPQGAQTGTQWGEELPASGQSSGQSSPGQSGTLSNPFSAFGGDGRRASWHAEVERTARGHRIGNPDAEAHLIEFMNYTCSDCARFAREGEGALDLALLAPGHMTLEVRPIIRNAIDLTVSLLVQCGEPEDFKDRHRMFLARQDDWLPKATSAPQSQQALWARGDRTSRANMAAALNLDDMLAERGMSRSDINRCINDDRAALTLTDNSQADLNEFGVTGTPGFALDGAMLPDVHDWETLYPVLSARFRPGSGR